MDLSNNLKNRYCPKLFTFIEVTRDGGCWLCCPAWLPKKIGNILTQSFDEIWNGDTNKLTTNLAKPYNLKKMLTLYKKFI